MIDVSGWGEFKVGDLFDKLTLKCLKEDFNKSLDCSEEPTDEFSLPLTNAKHFNNGIQFYGRPEDWESAEMTIDIVSNGAIATGDVYAQPQRTGVLWDSYLIKCKYEIQSELVLQYMACVIQRCVKQFFGWDDKCTWDKVKKQTVNLPITRAGEPDWAYMESYMKRIMKKSEENLSNLIKADYTKHLIDVSDWGEFSCRKLFLCKNTGNILARDVEDGSGTTPFVTASGYNNGVAGYIDASKFELIKGHCILVGGKTFTITYQKDDFVSNDSHNFVIRVKDYDISDLSYLYLVSTIYAYFGQKYSWNDAVTKDKLMDDNIPLPINSNNEPDWHYMEDYMKRIMEKCDRQINSLSIAAEGKAIDSFRSQRG